MFSINLYNLSAILISHLRINCVFIHYLFTHHPAYVYALWACTRGAMVVNRHFTLVKPHLLNVYIPLI